MVNGFIFAAGFGERLRPLTEFIPKSLIPVLNLPSICYSVFLLKKAGINNIMCNLHYMSEEIITFFKRNNSFGLNICFSIEKTILGTGGGLKKCEDWMGDEEFILMNSDVVSDIDLSKLIDNHSTTQSSATLVLYKTTHSKQIGPVGVVEGKVVDFNNIRGTGLTSDLIYTGIAVLSPVIFKYLSEELSSIVNTGYVGLIDNQSLGYFEHKGYWHDIGSIESYYDTNIKSQEAIFHLKDRISEILNLCPCILSPVSKIHQSAVIRNSVIGDGVTIGENASIEESVILPNTNIERNVNIKNSIVYPEGIVDVCLDY